MKTTREDTPQREAVLQIELDDQDLAPYLDRAYRRLSQRVRIPGFRPGKAPRQVVESFIGKEGLLEEALDKLVPETVAKVIEAEKVEAFSLPRLEQVKAEEPVTIKATVPLEPQIDLGDLSTVRIERKPAEVEEAEVNKVVEELRTATAPWEPVDRPAKFGDQVVLDMSGWVEGRRIADDKATEYVLRQDSPYPLPGFVLHIEGLSKDQTKEFTLQVPADFHDKSIADKEARFQVKLLEVKEKRLPPLDDAFARSIGEGFETLEALQKKVREDLKEEAERAEKRRVQDEALGALVKQAAMTFSPLLVDRELDEMMDERAHALRDQRMSMDDYLQAVGKTESQVRDELRASAEERLKRSLILGKLAKDQGIKVEDEEVGKEIDRLASGAGDPETVKAALSRERSKSSIGNAMLTRKVLDKLVEMVSDGASAPTAAPETEAKQSEGTQTEEKSGEGAPHGT